MPRKSKKRQVFNPEVLLNLGLATIVTVMFLYGVFTSSFTAEFSAVWGVLFVIWLVHNLYLKDKKNFRNNLASSIQSLVMYMLIFVVVFFILYVAFYKNASSSLQYVISVIPLSIAVFAFLIIYKGLKTQKIPNSLGFGAGNFSLKNLGLGVMIFGVIICLEIAIALISQLVSVQINTNVASIFGGSPIWFLAFASLIEPINEEIFFRGFMTPRLGVLPSAMLFGIVHYTYNSTFGIEPIAAFAFGLLVGYVYRRTKSLYPGMLAHIMINSIAAFSIGS